MKHLVQFILEASVQDMKAFISKNIDDTNDEKIIKRIYDILVKSNINLDVIDNFLKSRAIDDAKKMILSAFDRNSQLSEFCELCVGNISLPGVNELLAGNNIYDVFGGLGINKEVLKDIAVLNPPHDGTARGYYEILSQLLLKDLTDKNKGKGDVNAGGYELEYKAPNARIRGRSLKPSVLIEQKFRELIGDKVDYNKLPKKTGVLSTQENIKYLFSKELMNENPKDMANVIAQSICAQFNSKDDINKFTAFAENHVNDIFPGGKCDRVDPKFIQYMFGVAGLYFYQQDENFSHMILFKGNEKNDKGDYIVIPEDAFNNFESLYNTIKSLGVRFASFPQTDGKITPQSEAVQIYVK